MFHLYFHGGSGNHGCEAIVRTTAKLIGKSVALWSLSPEEDCSYDLNSIVKVYNDKEKTLSKKGWEYYFSAISHKLMRNDYRYTYFEHKDLRQMVRPGDICMSIGGDNYCYPGTDILGYYNRMLQARRARTVLWGCSIDPELITTAVKKDLMRYDLITVRDSLTYEGLIRKGISQNVILCADPAFLLDTIHVDLGCGFRKENTIGINVSPLVIKMDSMVWENYINLIRYILNETKDNILLIPHVVKPDTDDRIVLSRIKEEYNSNPRIALIDDCNCMKLKGYISQCRMFVGARTHSVIAAYSSCVPTLAVGYSIKAKGIAKDIFGSYEQYVLPIDEMKESMALVNAYRKIYESSAEIEDYLEQVMPSYKQKATKAADALKRLGI